MADIRKIDEKFNLIFSNAIHPVVAEMILNDEILKDGEYPVNVRATSEDNIIDLIYVDDSKKTITLEPISSKIAPLYYRIRDNFEKFIGKFSNNEDKKIRMDAYDKYIKIKEFNNKSIAINVQKDYFKKNIENINGEQTKMWQFFDTDIGQGSAASSITDPQFTRGSLGGVEEEEEADVDDDNEKYEQLKQEYKKLSDKESIELAQKLMNENEDDLKKLIALLVSAGERSGHKIYDELEDYIKTIKASGGHKSKEGIYPQKEKEIEEQDEGEEEQFEEEESKTPDPNKVDKFIDRVNNIIDNTFNINATEIGQPKDENGNVLTDEVEFESIPFYKDAIFPLSLKIYLGSSSHPNFNKNVFQSFVGFDMQNNKDMMYQHSSNIVNKYGIELFITSLPIGPDADPEKVFKQFHEIVQIFLSYRNPCCFIGDSDKLFDVKEVLKADNRFAALNNKDNQQKRTVSAPKPYISDAVQNNPYWLDNAQYGEVPVFLDMKPEYYDDPLERALTRDFMDANDKPAIILFKDREIQPGMDNILYNKVDNETKQVILNQTKDLISGSYEQYDERNMTNDIDDYVYNNNDLSKDITIRIPVMNEEEQNEFDDDDF